MKHKTIYVGVLASLALCGVVYTLTSVNLRQDSIVPAKVSADQNSRVDVPLQSTVRSDLPSRDPLATPPRDGSLSVWYADGVLDEEVVTRYQLTSLQIDKLHALRSEALRRMQSIDVANAEIAVSEDGQSIFITVRANAAAAREFTEFYESKLAQILGPRNYADLAKFHYVSSTDEVMNAGLMDKDVEITKLPANERGAEYYIKAERKIRTTPKGWPARYDSHASVARGDRATLMKAYLSLPAMLPKDF